MNRALRHEAGAYREHRNEMVQAVHLPVEDEASRALALTGFRCGYVDVV